MMRAIDAASELWAMTNAGSGSAGSSLAESGGASTPYLINLSWSLNTEVQ